MKIEFVVWQFVRMMVELESLARPRGRNARDTFRARNTGTWNALDKELETLGQADATKYAKRMMKDTVVINTKTPAQVVEVSDALGRVINHMGAELRRGADDDPAKHKHQWMPPSWRDFEIDRYATRPSAAEYALE